MSELIGRKLGKYTLEARLGLQGSVTWVAPRPDVERLYAAADAVALPARYEPFGNVHLEALASGVPVLTSAMTGGSEVVGDGESGAVTASLEPSDIGSRTRPGRPRSRSPMRLRSTGSSESTASSRPDGASRPSKPGFSLINPDQSITLPSCPRRPLAVPPCSWIVTATR